MIQCLNLLSCELLETWGHLPQKLCFHHSQYAPIANHALWFTSCYQSFFLPLRWKSEGYSSWLINLKPWSKRISFSLLLYFTVALYSLEVFFHPLVCMVNFHLFNSLQHCHFSPERLFIRETFSFTRLFWRLAQSWLWLCPFFSYSQYAYSVGNQNLFMISSRADIVTDFHLPQSCKINIL